MLRRIKHLTLDLLISFDQFVQTLVFGIYYLIFGGANPNPDETISSVVGKASMSGKPWAKVAEKVINFIFGLLGEKNHCFNSIEVFKE